MLSVKPYINICGQKNVVVNIVRKKRKKKLPGCKDGVKSSSPRQMSLGRFSILVDSQNLLSPFSFNILSI